MMNYEGTLLILYVVKAAIALLGGACFLQYTSIRVYVSVLFNNLCEYIDNDDNEIIIIGFFLSIF